VRKKRSSSSVSPERASATSGLLARIFASRSASVSGAASSSLPPGERTITKTFSKPPKVRKKTR
jgi:hypothetical protein